LTLIVRFSYNIVFRVVRKQFLGPPPERSLKDQHHIMANHFSALKRARQTEKRSVRNRANTSTLRTEIRSLRELLAGKDKAGAETRFRETAAAIDKAVQKGVIHKNTAARYKSRLSARLQKMA
jgi:small subunit ribosomal protein S20